MKINEAEQYNGTKEEKFRVLASVHNKDLINKIRKKYTQMNKFWSQGQHLMYRWGGKYTSIRKMTTFTTSSTQQLDVHNEASHYTNIRLAQTRNQ